MSNPNGLTDEQIAARPDPFTGMLYFDVELKSWAEREFPTYGRLSRIALLPGEPNCPWPPPLEFRRDWQEGDRAWILSEEGWIEAVVEDRDGILLFAFEMNLVGRRIWYRRVGTPANYIPEEQHQPQTYSEEGRD